MQPSRTEPQPESPHARHDDRGERQADVRAGRVEHRVFPALALDPLAARFDIVADVFAWRGARGRRADAERRRPWPCAEVRPADARAPQQGTAHSRQKDAVKPILSAKDRIVGAQPRAAQAGSSAMGRSSVIPSGVGNTRCRGIDADDIASMAPDLERTARPCVTRIGRRWTCGAAQRRWMRPSAKS